MIEAVRVGALSLEKLEAWTSLCSVGIDMVAVPGSTSAETIAAIIADEMRIGVWNNKTTAVRIIPFPPMCEIVEFGRVARQRAGHGRQRLSSQNSFAAADAFPRQFIRSETSAAIVEGERSQ